MIPVRNKTILVSPLPWGLGHAARIIPVLRYLVRDNKVVVFATPELLHYLQRYVPEIIPETEHIEAYKYKKSFSLSNAFSLPLWFIRIYAHERKSIKQLIKKHKPNLIISDNRYGWFDDVIPSILITHQVRPAFPWWTFPLKFLLYHWLIKKYRHFFQLWIPDYKERPGLAGKLSHVSFLKKLNHCYVGPISRFGKQNPAINENYAIWILSGPASHRKWMLQKILSYWKHINFPLHVVGMAQNDQLLQNVTIHDLTDPVVDDLIIHASYLISHAGYSTLMDLENLEKKGWIYPTAGQYEQKYLVRFHRKKHYTFKNEKKLLKNLKKELQMIKERREL